jgi:hypothetical protein
MRTSPYPIVATLYKYDYSSHEYKAGLYSYEPYREKCGLRGRI